MTRSNKKKFAGKTLSKHPPTVPSPKSEKVIFKRAIASAGKHGIKLANGTPNKADGNCAIESAIFNNNDRDCFAEKLLFSADYYRKIWMTDMKNRTLHDKTWNIYTLNEWEDGWADMMKSGVYERGIFGDLMILAIACGIRKYILIFNTSLETPHDPIYVCDPVRFGVQPDSEIPIVLAYDLSHYESLHTVGKEDTLKTIDLVKKYLNGNYEFGRQDMKHLVEYEEPEVMEQESFESELINNENEERSLGSKLFDESLPEHLRGKRPKEMSKEEKKEYNSHRRKINRSKESKERKEEIRINDRDRKAKSYQEETEEQANKRNEQNKVCGKKRKATENEDSANARKEQAKKCMKEAKAKETESQAKIRKEKEKNERASKRAQEPENQAKLRKEKEKVARALKRAENMTKSKYDARNALKVLAADQIVPELKNSADKIGPMTAICTDCGARKWKSETPSLCCNNGKVVLETFPQPPELIKKLLTSDTAEARLFRENIRPFNNALALSSIKVTERKFKNGYNPSVIYEGKVQQIFGPLQPEDGEQPRFAQLYVVDPATQHTMRVNNMSLPTHLKPKQIDVITQTMKNLQQLINDVNPFVKDLLHVYEIPDSELIDGKLIISCKERPKDAHPRTYNTQQSFSEVTVLTNSVPSDLVLRKRGGGLEFIYDLHPAAQPLHFVLLFPYGTKGYSEFMKHKDKDQTKRVSPREYFSYHLNMRNLEADFFFRCQRLFQEYICLAYATVENQKLKFNKNNQAALRADTYKNIREVLTDKVPIGDKISKDDHNLKIGKRIILPKSFVGSPRWYNSQFQDGMAICRKYHKPDFFITMTCNIN